jgi:arylsulfatase
LPNNDGFPGKYNTITTGLELYNLRRDPGEEYNVIMKYPDIAEELLEIAEEARKDMGDNLTEMKGINVRKHGTL